MESATKKKPIISKKDFAFLLGVSKRTLLKYMSATGIKNNSHGLKDDEIIKILDYCKK